MFGYEEFSREYEQFLKDCQECDLDDEGINLNLPEVEYNDWAENQEPEPE